MTIDERVHHAMSGLRLRTDELGRPPSHDEVAELLRRVVQEAEADVRAEVERLRAALSEVDRLSSDPGIHDEDRSGDIIHAVRTALGNRP
jgi:hypothetical protein